MQGLTKSVIGRDMRWGFCKECVAVATSKGGPERGRREKNAEGDNEKEMTQENEREEHHRNCGKNHS